MEIYEHVEGDPDELDIGPAIRDWLDRHPGEVWQEPGTPDRLYRKYAAADVYARLTISPEFYESSIYRSKMVLLMVLAALYVLAVLLLETVIMPRYVYRPIRSTLDADLAVMENDRAREIIDKTEILDDEIGDIMRSRNATVANLREKEARLERTLAELESVATDLRKKNQMLEDAKTHLAAQDRLASNRSAQRQRRARTEYTAQRSERLHREATRNRRRRANPSTARPNAAGHGPAAPDQCRPARLLAAHARCHWAGRDRPGHRGSVESGRHR